MEVHPQRKMNNMFLVDLWQKKSLAAPVVKRLSETNSRKPRASLKFIRHCAGTP